MGLLISQSFFPFHPLFFTLSRDCAPQQSSLLRFKKGWVLRSKHTFFFPFLLEQFSFYLSQFPFSTLSEVPLKSCLFSLSSSLLKISSNEDHAPLFSTLSLLSFHLHLKVSTLALPPAPIFRVSAVVLSLFPFYIFYFLILSPLMFL